MDAPGAFPEAARLAALADLAILDTPSEPRFDRFTRLAAMAFGAPISLISLVDEDRQWFKSRCGLEAAETPRSMAFCSHAVAARRMLVVEDALLDPRFADNPLVLGAPHIRFYAGQPVYSAGQAVGTLCVIDTVPRSLSPQQRQVLQDLACMVEVELNHAKTVAARAMAEQALKALNSDLEGRVAARTAELEDKVAQLSREVAQRKLAETALRQSEAWTRTIVSSSYSGFVGADSEGRVIEWNASAERIFGWPREQAMGKLLSELIVPPHLRTAHDQGLRRFVTSGESSVLDKKMELPALTACGRQITIEMTISTYLWHGEHYFGAFCNDISERIRTRQQLEEKQELLDAVLESIDVAVVACDAVGNLSLFNRTARKVLGRDRQPIAPAEWSHYYALYHADGRTAMAMDELPLVRALKGEVVRDQSLVIAPAGQAAATVLASGRPLRNAQGHTLGAVVVMKDVSELAASKELLAASERRLRAITENLPTLIGKVDAQGRFVFLNGRALQFYGKGADELIGQDIASAYTPEAYARLQPYFERAAAGERVYFEHAMEVGGCLMHYQCCFIPQRATSGAPDGFFAMAFDISARKMSELAQADSEERLRTITDNLPVLIAYLDQERRYRFANAVHGSWLGKAPGAIIGRTMCEAFGDDYFVQQKEALDRAWKGEAAQCEHEIVRKKHARIVHSTFLPQFRDGAVVGVYVLTTDATASRLHERSLHALAHTDALTKIPNRRQFEIGLQGAIERSLQRARRFALFYLDIDHFKQINDTHGHAVGDMVLVEFARRLQKAVRSSDLVARLAGDEFTVLLDEVQSEDDLERVAHKILLAMRAPFELGTLVLEVTTTVGVGLADGTGVTAESISETADQALYLAKRAGRNTFAIRRNGEPLLSA
ncbi:PAS domain-containing protein [Massilia niastensis]|uniref:PAS domain-containing protein n=1 Tax=Massilia niastensis TaxID=544911 RepID=UPI00035C42DD|nr:PAS domain-containing protein [Massilia niastensis]